MPRAIITCPPLLWYYVVPFVETPVVSEVHNDSLKFEWPVANNVAVLLRKLPSPPLSLPRKETIVCQIEVLTYKVVSPEAGIVVIVGILLPSSIPLPQIAILRSTPCLY